jgi:TolB-like protein
MQLVFDGFLLDTRRGDLRFGEHERPLEPRAFSLLSLLVENHDRLVSRDEILEKIWDGRIVTDSAVSTVLKAVRRALGDDGEAQKYIRTVRGRGFRFVAPVKILPDGQPSPPPAVGTAAETQRPPPAPGDSKPSIAVLPFSTVGYSEAFGALGDAIPAELISSLSRLRWLRVIARGSSFRFRNRETDPDAVRGALNVGYCMNGLVEIFGTKLIVVVELVDARTHDVVWSERFLSKIDDVHEIRAQIVGSVIAALELRIPLHEAEKARLTSPGALDAWSEYHVGLQHMYRFNRADNTLAAALFERATAADPRFARAFAARSFTSFQSAFMKYSSDPDKDASDARRFAERSLEIDPMDPFGTFNLARTHWLAGNPDGGLELLGRAIEVNPNFAQAHYARAWTDTMAGRGDTGLASVDTAISLSPLDPLLYAMYATRGFGYLILGDYSSAAQWAERGAQLPASHFLIGAIAVAAHALNGDSAKAGYWARDVRRRREDASIEHFFTAFPFSDARIRKSISRALAAHGFPSGRR